MTSRSGSFESLKLNSVFDFFFFFGVYSACSSDSAAKSSSVTEGHGFSIWTSESSSAIANGRFSLSFLVFSDFLPNSRACFKASFSLSHLLHPAISGFPVSVFLSSGLFRQFPLHFFNQEKCFCKGFWLSVFHV